MANPKHLSKLKQGVQAWNSWRFQHPKITPDLRDADLNKIDLGGSYLGGIHLGSADLRGVQLNEANLFGAHLYNSKLDNAHLTGACLRWTVLYQATLRGAILSHADLREASFTDADLRKANLTNADLAYARLVDTKLEGANFTGCIVHGISAWNVFTSDETIMRDLVISKDKKNNPMTIDGLEVAQFVYFLWKNKKINKAIDLIRTKMVLILGSFDPESMLVLETLKQAIRNHPYGYIPLLFDFEKPETQELMETVKTMALLSNFVIVDLSVRSGQLHELANLVQNTYIPFVTIARRGTDVTAMHREFVHFYWYRDKYIPYSHKNAKEQIPKLFIEKILPWAKKINVKIMKKRQNK